MENPVTAVKKNMAVRAAIPVAIGVTVGVYLIISAYAQTLNPMKWRARITGTDSSSSAT